MKNTPRVRFKGFSEEWEKESFEDFFLCFIPTNILSRAALTFEKKEIRNIHYGDILIKFGSVLDVEKESIPFIAENTDELKSHLLKNGDIIFADAAEDETVGKCTELLNILDSKVVSGLHTIACRPNKSTQNGFLGYYLNSYSYRKQLLKLMQGIKVLSISKTNLTKTSLQTPTSQNEQAKIGDFFKNIDTLIAKNQQKHEKLTQMKKALLEKVFPKTDAKEPEIRFQGFSGEWKKNELKNLSYSIQYGLNAAAIPYDGKNKYIRITDINDETRHFTHDDLTSPKAHLDLAENYTLQKGDILFARTGASVGKTYHYNPHDGLVYFAGFLIRARIKKEVNSEFVFQNTLSSAYTKFIEITSQRSGQPGVNAQEYGEFSFMLPHSTEQAKIGELFRLLDKRIALQQGKIEKLKNMKHAFLENMFV